MKDRIAKFAKQVEDLNARQEAALAAADAEGISEEDQAKHLAEFDRLQAEKEKVQSQLKRAEQLDRDQAAAAAPARPAVVQQPHNPQESVSQIRVPATFRRHGPLRAFTGADAVDRAERAGMWFAAALWGNNRAARWCQENGLDIVQDPGDRGTGAVLNTSDNKGAGYFVPNEVDYTIHELALQYGLFRRFAETVTMGSGTKESPRWTAAMTAYWIGQGNKPTSSDPAWDMIKLAAKDLAAMTKMTRQLDEDSVVDLGDKVTMALAEAFTYAEDNAGFNGDATSSYGGITGLVTKILASSAAYHQAASGNVSDITLDLDDFNGVVAKLPNYPNFQPRWYMHKTFWANSAQRLQMALGGVVPADVQAGAKPMLLGYPVEFTNVLDSTPTVDEIAAILGDLRWSSKIGDRRGRTVERGFENDDFTKQLMTILGTERVDIVNHTVTDPRSTSNPGPVVGLKLASS